uniref:Uncharacterized protein n=1 Tax=viral metagenome TaxID=1070528 RepID=A0A6M3K667_9ZZZZ
MKKLSRNSIFILWNFGTGVVVLQSLWIISEALRSKYRHIYRESGYTDEAKFIDTLMQKIDWFGFWGGWISGASVTLVIMILFVVFFMDWKDETDYIKKFKKEQEEYNKGR